MARKSRATIEREEEEIIQQGREALERIRRRTFDDWMMVARALNIGRREAMAVAGTDDIHDRGYQKEFSRWLGAHPPFDDLEVLPRWTRAWLLKCFDHEAEIRAWRKGKKEEELRHNYPEDAFKRWAKVCRPELLTEQQREKKGNKQNERAQQIDESVEKLKRVAEEADAARTPWYDLSPDTIDESARMFIDIYGVDDATRFIEALKQAISEQKRPRAKPTARRQAEERINGSDVHSA